MGGSTLPTASTPGYTSCPAKYGPDVACDCLAAWIPVFSRLCELMGYGTPVVWQLTGDNENSGGVHSKGGAVDFGGIGNARARLAREMGAPATWPRAWTNNYHTHGVLNGCPHNGPARYQLDAQRAGYDGLGYLGRGGPDPLKGSPSTYRTWAQGITWAKAKIEILEDPMPALSDDEQRQLLALLKETRNRVMGGIPAGSAIGRENPNGTPARVLDSADGDYLRIKITEGDATTKAALGEQLDTLAKSVADLTSLVTTLTASVATTNDKVDALTTKVDALPKA